MNEDNPETTRVSRPDPVTPSLVQGRQSSTSALNAAPGNPALDAAPGNPALDAAPGNPALDAAPGNPALDAAPRGADADPHASTTRPPIAGRFPQTASDEDDAIDIQAERYRREYGINLRQGYRLDGEADVIN
ncbi:hypothetical protein ACOMHN_008883 [Nucella lapillus]